MLYLLDHLNLIQGYIKGSDPLFLMFDFDGTLSPIVDVPNKASIDPQIKKSLTHLVANSKIQIGIISGRSLIDLKKKISIDGLFMAGNHGFEWIWRNRTYRYPLSVRNKRDYKNLCQLCLQLSHIYHGILIEDKKYSITIHYRLLQPSQELDFKQYWETIIKPEILRSSFYIEEGKKVYNLKPSVSWNKGCLIHKYCAFNHLIYFGDDVTDEDVFAMTNESVTVRVGESHTSKALYYVKSVKDVAYFLGWLERNCR